MNNIIINNDSKKSFVVSSFGRFLEWGNKKFVISNLLFNKHNNIFIKLEIMTIVILFLSLLILIFIRDLPKIIGIIICILLVQRILEFFIVYSRNFIFHRGRVFLFFNDAEKSGQWLLIMFGLNLIQIIFIFAIWYQMISTLNPMAFSQELFAINSLYYSFTTFVTVGYGDISALSNLAQVVAIGQMVFTFYTLVIVVNGLISIHFNNSNKV